MLIASIAALAVGVLILIHLPSSAAWAIGLLVGIKLIISGWAYLFLPMAVAGLAEAGKCRSSRLYCYNSRMRQKLSSYRELSARALVRLLKLGADPTRVAFLVYSSRNAHHSCCCHSSPGLMCLG